MDYLMTYLKTISMTPIIYMVQTMVWIAHNDRKRADTISKQVTRVGEANGLKYIVIENKED
jgi:hypothetical protein